MGGRRAGELPQGARPELVCFTEGPGCAVQGANAADFALDSGKGGLERPWRGGKGGGEESYKRTDWRIV